MLMGGPGNDKRSLYDKRSLWKGLESIRMPYTIRDADDSGRNDKFSLYSTNVLLRMILRIILAHMDFRP